MLKFCRCLPFVLALLLGLMSLSPAGATPLGDLIASDAAVKAALVSSRVKDRDALIEQLGQNLDAGGAALLQELAAGRLYVSRNGGIYQAAEDGTFLSLDGRENLTASKGLKRVGTSTAQRTQIGALMAAYSLRSEDEADRALAVHSLLEPGAQLPDLETLNTLAYHESVQAIYEDLKVAAAMAMARDPQAGVQEQLRAVELLEDKGSSAALQALHQFEDNTPYPEVAAAAASAAGTVSFYHKCADVASNLFFGLSLGSVLILAAIGLAITFGVMGVINMAHGELIMIGAYCVWVLQQLLPGSPGLALILSIPCAFVVSGLVGILIERTVISKLYGRPLETLLATFGVSLILQQAVRTIFSPLNRAVQTPAFMQGSLQITENFSVTLSRLCIIVFCILTFALILFIINHTRLGLEVRAVSQNRAIARALGVRAARVDALTFGLGSGAAGMAGVALSQITNVGPNLGQNYIVDTFMVVVFGGVGNLWGTLCGGLIMGMASKLLEPVSGAMLSKIVILIALIIFIQKRPRGLFPQRGRAVEA